ncbi:MAG: TolC family protein [Bacteroidales bacterium]|nr:TolC family protein [Bacteroidota bacterium]MBL6949927.1 TolC family protein [Bacteroidales bacterium]
MKAQGLVICSLFITCLVQVSGSVAQTPMSFSLKQAQEYAYEHNYDLKNSQYNVEIAEKLIKENTAIGLPQIDGSISYIDYLQLPTSLIPGDFFGQPGKDVAVQFGTKYNATISGQINQLLYSGQYLVGLQTAKAFLETEKQKDVKNRIDVRDFVAEAYISYLIVNESIEILDSTFHIVNQMVDETMEFYKSGLMEQLDVEQMELNKATLEATLITTRNQKVIAYNYLRFLLGIEDEEIALTDSLNFFLERINQDYLMTTPFDYNYNVDYKLLKKQEHLVFMQYRLAKTAYQPTLTAFMDFSTNAQRNSWNFFKSGEPWYGTINWGVSLYIPIWSSGNRKYKVDQARLEVDKMKVMDEKVRNSLKIQVETVRNDFMNSYLVFLNKKQSLKTAFKIYEQTVIKYRQGISSSTDLNQKYNQFLFSETEYTQALFDLLKSNIALSKLLEKV